jgi:hypothetical protein
LNTRNESSDICRWKQFVDIVVNKESFKLISSLEKN